MSANGERGNPRSVGVGSLCTGYAGLDLALGSVLDTSLEWYAENDLPPASLLAQRFPDVPNLHDITTVDWSAVEPVEVLTAGYPCQPFSQAGKRQGSKDERHLWPFIRDAIRALRPRIVVLENVAGHLSLGFDRVLADLAELGFHAEWALVRASDVGACHRRSRLFVVATDPVSGVRRGGDELPQPAGRRGLGQGPRGDAEPGGLSPLLADADGGRREQRDQGQRRVPIAREGDAQPPADPAGARLPRRQDTRANRSDASEVRRGREQSERGHSAPVPDPYDLGCEGAFTEPWRDDSGSGGGVAWGVYEPAIRRHERILGRPAPAPVDEGGRLNPVFVEWMMMLPAGWVTDAGLSKTATLKMLGNGVVPPQAAHALRGLIGRAA